MSPQVYQYQFWTDFEDLQKIRKIWYSFRHETQNVKYVFLNTGSNKIIPLWFYALDTLSMSPKGISTNSGPILGLCKKNRKIKYFFGHETQNNVKYMFFIFRNKQNYFTMVFML